MGGVRLPILLGARTRRDRRDRIGKFHNRSYTVPGLEFYECPKCGERVYDRAAMRRIESRSPAYGGRRKGRHAM